MILIISEQKDVSTHDVIDWLVAKSIPYFVVNHEDVVQQVHCTIQNGKTTLVFQVNGHSIDMDRITAFWYRRGGLWYQLSDNLRESAFQKYITQHQSNEWICLSDFMHELLEEKPSLGSFEKEKYNNKLSNLHVAQRCGLAIPHTFIISDKNDITDLYERQFIITKSLNHDVYVNQNNEVEFANFGPMVIEKQHIDRMDDVFFPSLMQSYVDKKYELRIFVLHDKLYSAALFSQSDATYQIDSRKINANKPIRMTPYRLPAKIKRKLLQYMKKTGQNTASIDMIVTQNDEYVFLESNPVGQFGYLSYNCNYHLEYEVFQFLSKQ